MKSYHIKIIVKNWLFNLTSPFFLNFPSLLVRRLYLSVVLKRMGSNNYFARGLDVREPFRIEIGNNNVINKKVLLDGRGGLVIGNNVDIAQESMIWTAQHDPNDDYHVMTRMPVEIEDYVWVASRATVLPGVTLHKGCVVASNAVVTKNVESKAVVAGIPAKKLYERKSKLLYQLNFHPFFG